MLSDNRLLLTLIPPLKPSMKEPSSAPPCGCGSVLGKRESECTLLNTVLKAVAVLPSAAAAPAPALAKTPLITSSCKLIAASDAAINRFFSIEWFMQKAM
jgi:hypothetical protein